MYLAGLDPEARIDFSIMFWVSSQATTLGSIDDKCGHCDCCRRMSLLAGECSAAGHAGWRRMISGHWIGKR